MANRLVKQLTKDKKKLSLMLGLLAVGLLLWGRLLLKEGPKTAAAKPENNPLADVNPQPAAQGGQPASVSMATVYVDFPEGLSRDVFALNPAQYPKKSSSDNPKLDARMDDERQVGAELEELTLDSTILGARPRAMINGRVVAVGDLFEGYRIRAIRDRRVYVEKNGVIFRLRMKVEF